MPFASLHLLAHRRPTAVNKILLIRHGHVAGIDPPRFRGRAELSLTALGQQQAQRVASRIACGWTPQMVYTSPLRRCVDTGTAIAAASGLKVTVMEELNDLDYGAWQGKSWNEAQAADSRLFETWRRAPHEVVFPSGESLLDVAARVNRALQFVRQTHPDQTIVMVSHDSVNRVILLLSLALSMAAYWRLVQDPCCINEIVHDADGLRVHRINETAHILG
jgi:phosphoserine phosphatase